MGQPAGACVTARPTGCAEGGQGRWGRPGARWLAPNHPMRSWLAPLCLACDGIGQLPFHREAHAHQATLKEACGQPAPSVHHFCCQLACITRLWFRRWPARLKPPTRSEFALAQETAARCDGRHGPLGGATCALGEHVRMNRAMTRGQAVSRPYCPSSAGVFKPIASNPSGRQPHLIAWGYRGGA